MLKLDAPVYLVGVQRCVRVSAQVGTALGGGPRPAVVVTPAGQRFASTLLPAGGGDYRVVIPAKLLKTMGAEPGDVLELSLEPDPCRAAPTVPADVRAALEAAMPDGLDLLTSQTVSKQRQLLLYIDEARAPATRTRRIERLITDFILPLRDKPRRGGQDES